MGKNSKYRAKIPPPPRKIKLPLPRILNNFACILFSLDFLFHLLSTSSRKLLIPRPLPSPSTLDYQHVRLQGSTSFRSDSWRFGGNEWQGKERHSKKGASYTSLPGWASSLSHTHIYISQTNGVFEMHIKNSGGKELVYTIDLKKVRDLDEWAMKMV